MTRDVGGVLLEPGFGPASQALHRYLTPQASGARPDVTVRWGPVTLAGPTRTVARRLDLAVDGPPTLLWRHAAGLPIDLLARWEFGHLQLTAQLARDRREQVLRTIRPQRLAQQLLYLLGIYPAAWVARRVSGAALVHASVVTLRGHGVLIAGPGGVGKSSLAAAALGSGGCLVSDNLVLASPTELRGWQEPVRLAANLVGKSGLHDVGSNGWHGRRDLRLDAERWAQATAPSLVIVPSLSDQARIHPCEDAGPWADRVLAAGSLAGELTRWPAFAAALDHLAPAATVPARDTVRALLDGVPLRRVDLPRHADPDALRTLLHDLTHDLSKEGPPR